jgi:23S rRNA pseudouridine955/2504/2580 synthase
MKGGRGYGDSEKMICVHPAKMADYPDAKRAHTDYFTLWFLGNRISWLAMEPVTGRTHQLRAHIAEMGFPIIGDGKYGGSSTENMGDGWGAGIGGDLSRKLHLHARMLKVQHPITKEMMTFIAPLPEHMARTWKTLDWGENDVPLDPFGGDE